MKDRWFDVTIGYCPQCECNQFFKTFGLSGTCPMCGTFVLIVSARTTEVATQTDVAGEQSLASGCGKDK